MLVACTTWYAQCPGMLNYQLIYSNMESESMNLNTIRTNSEYNFVKLFNEALAENDDIGTINGSPFDHGHNECKFYSPENFAQNIHPTNNSLSLFCLKCRSISANWDCIHELIRTLSSRGFLFDIIGLTEVFKMPDCMLFNITGYHCLQFQTRSDTDDGRGGVGYLLNSIQFSLFPAHINISYNIDNVHIMCRKRGGQKTVLMNVHPQTLTVVNYEHKYYCLK